MNYTVRSFVELFLDNYQEFRFFDNEFSEPLFDNKPMKASEIPDWLMYERIGSVDPVDDDKTICININTY